MAESRSGLLALGVFLIIIVVAVLLVALDVISWWLVVPVILVFSGVWMLALAAMHSPSSQKYGRDAFSTLSIGLLMIAVGGAWYLFTYNWLYSLALVLLVLGGIAIAAALRKK